MTDKLIEVLRDTDVIGDMFAGTGGVTGGLGVYASGNKTVNNAADAKYILGVACLNTSAGDVAPVILRGRVRIYNNTTVFGGTWTSVAVGSPVYIAHTGKWTHTAGAGGVVNVRGGIVVNKGTDFMDVELDIDRSKAVDDGA